MENSLVLDTFARLEQAAVTYCVLRGYDELAEGGDGEIDILVAADHFAQLAGVLAAQGFAALAPWGYAPHRFFVAYDRANGRWLKFDVVSDFWYGRPIRALKLGDAEGCLRHRVRRGSVYVLSPEDEFAALFLHCLLDKAGFRDRRGWRLLELQNQLAHNQLEDVVAERLGHHLGQARWQKMMMAVADQEWESILKHRVATARRLFWRDPLGSLQRTLSTRLFRALRPLFFALRRRGLTVALLAPDGAGKTTLAQALAGETFLRARLVYTGTNAETRTTSLPTSRWLHTRLKAGDGKSGGESGLRIILKGLHFVNRLAEQWYRLWVASYHISRGRFVIFDRYVYDAWLTKRNTTLWKRFRRWLLESGWMTPDIVVLLNAPGEVLFQRKREHTPAWLERQRLAYLELRDRIPHMIVVDATAAAEEVRRQVVAIIWNEYRLRTNRGINLEAPNGQEVAEILPGKEVLVKA